METLLFFTCIAWLYYYGHTAFMLKKIQGLEEIMPSEGFSPPELSVIIAACNEENTIGPALQSLLAQDYPALEVIVVNDRSTDNTGEILAGLVAKYPALKTITVTSLPDGWLGKVHALHQGASQASGKWLLFTDADIHFRGGALQNAVYYAEQHSLDHLAVAPRMQAETFFLKTMFLTFAWIFYFMNRGLPAFLRRNTTVGIGAFNLVRREAFRRTPGFEWLKMEVADDVGLALMIKKSGGNSSFIPARDDISVSWYHSVGDMARGLEKNLFGATSGYNIFRSFAQAISGTLFSAGPLLALFSGNPVLFTAAALAVCLFVLVSIAVSLQNREALLPALAVPLGQIILYYMLLRSALLCKLRGGIYWRGTLYKTAELKKGRRVGMGI